MKWIIERLRGTHRSPYDSYQVIGLQRTGTNWINELIKLNFKAPERKVFWKHLTFLGIKEERIPRYAKYGLNLKTREKTFFIVTSKPFELWQKSIERNPEDFFNSHDFQSEDPINEVYMLWSEWQRKHLNEHNFYYKDYLEWFDHWELLLAEIQDITGWEKRYKNKGFVNVEKVPRSPNFQIENYNKKDN